MTEKELLEILKNTLIETERNDIEVIIKRYQGDYEHPKVRFIKKPSNKGYYNSKNRRNK